MHGETLAPPDDPHDRCLASRLIDHIGDLDINVAVVARGRNAQHGWEVHAWRDDCSERWELHGDRIYPLACELALMVGVDLQE